MLKAKRKMMNEKPAGSMGTIQGATLHEDRNCSSQSPRPAKRACVELATGNYAAAEAENPVAASAWDTSEISNMSSSAPQPVNMLSVPPERPGTPLNGIMIPDLASKFGGTSNWSMHDDYRLQTVLTKFNNPIDWELVAIDFCSISGVIKSRT